MFIILVVVYFLVFDLFFLIELCCRFEMLLTNIMNICYNGVILLKFIFFFEFYKFFRVIFMIFRVYV